MILGYFRKCVDEKLCSFNNIGELDYEGGDKKKSLAPNCNLSRDRHISESANYYSMWAPKKSESYSKTRTRNNGINFFFSFLSAEISKGIELNVGHCNVK